MNTKVHEKDDYRSTVKDLNKYYLLVKQQILSHQGLTSGLFPFNTEVPNDKKEAKIRDSIYCAVSVWALALAYRRINNDNGRTYELEQSAVKCMRGILYCYTRQADKVETFKSSQHPSYALHSKFYWSNGDPITEHYTHLQVDVVALYLYFLAQMISSGLQIIYTLDEVNFVQNLIYYIERAYRTPDYGMWERGSKYFNGSLELHASSIGMCKAALEVINGFNLFGDQGASWSVVYVDIDAHYRNKVILSTLLPRESSSKNTDASLLPTISWPAFAVQDDSLCQKTLHKAVRKLQGKHGFKRWLRDGYGTVVEDRNRRFYRPAELKLFDGIESEWPLFYIYLIIDGVAKKNPEQIKTYTDLLEPLLTSTQNGKIVPRYYYVPQQFLDKERESPGSQLRYCTDEGVDGKIFLYGQALYIIANLLVDNLLSMSELDPLGKYKESERSTYSITKQPTRNCSTFQSPPDDLTIQLVLIAESTWLQTTLAMYGIQTQTPKQVEPYEIWPPSELVKAYELLGRNKNLNLSGRPLRPIGTLGTSKIYRILGRTVLCYPIILEWTDFYMTHDISMLIDNIKTDFVFLQKSWCLNGRPTFCLLLREDQFSGSHMKEMLDMLALIKRGEVDGVKIQVDRLQTLIPSSFIEHLDFSINIINLEVPLSFEPLEELDVCHVKSPQKTSTSPLFKHPSLTRTDTDDAKIINEEALYSKTGWELARDLKQAQSLRWQTVLLAVLYNKEGPNYITSEGPVVTQLQKVYHLASTKKDWSTVRYCASTLGKVVDSLAPSITTMLVRAKLLTVGVFGHEEEVFSKPMTPAQIYKAIQDKCSKYEVRQVVLQQEIIINLAKVISTTPHLFDGMLKIRVGWIIQAMKRQLSVSNSYSNVKNIYSLSPTEIKDLMMSVLVTPSVQRSWLQKRQLDGALNRAPPLFYDRIWDILSRTPKGMRIAGHTLAQQPTQSDMTKHEINFAIQVEDMLGKITLPEYRQMMIELLVVVSTVLERNPELEFRECVDMDMLLKNAFEEFQNTHGPSETEDMCNFFNTTPNLKGGTASYMAKAVINHLLDNATGIELTDNCVIS